MGQTKEGAIKSAAKMAGMAESEYRDLLAQGLNRCTKCKNWRSREDFGSDAYRPDKRDRRCHYCRRNPNKSTSNLFKPGQPSLFKGHKHSEQAKAKQSAAKKGKRFRLGIKHTAETRAKISKAVRLRTPRGVDHPAYKHGKAQRNLYLRRTVEYREWRQAVFARDNYTCQNPTCNDSRGGNLRAHHIKPVWSHPELVYDVDNGKTLCHRCHELEHFKPDSIRNVRKLKRGEKLWK